MSQNDKGVTILHPKVNSAVRDFLNHRIDRREMLRRAAVAGAGAMTLNSLLTMRRAGAQATPDAQAAGYAITVPANLRTDLAGQTIGVILADQSSVDNPFLDAAIALFTEATGITVNRTFGETSATDRLQNYRQRFAAQQTDIDVFQIDVIWPGMMVDFALDLSEPLADLAAQHFEAIVQNNTVDGKLVAIPYFTDAGLLYYRTDLLDKYGLQVPTTWAELEEYATQIMEGERANNPQFLGYLFQGAAYEGLTCNGLEWQVSNGGGFIVEQETGEVTVNNPQAIAAFDRAAGWVGTIAPQEVVNWQEPDTLNQWVAGNAAFARNWPYMYSASQDAASAVAGMVDVAVLPKGEGENARNAATLGGWNLMVSAFSQAPEAGIEFVKYMCSPEMQKAAAIENSRLPTIAELYDDPDIAAASEFMPRLRDVFQGGAIARPSTVTGERYADVSQIYFQQLNAVLTGSQDGATAAANMEAEINAVLGGL